MFYGENHEKKKRLKQRMKFVAAPYFFWQHDGSCSVLRGCAAAGCAAAPAAHCPLPAANNYGYPTLTLADTPQDKPR